MPTKLVTTWRKIEGMFKTFFIFHAFVCWELTTGFPKFAVSLAGANSVFTGNWYPGDYANDRIKEFTRAPSLHSTRSSESEEVGDRPSHPTSKSGLIFLSACIFHWSYVEQFPITYCHVTNNNTQGRILQYCANLHLTTKCRVWKKRFTPRIISYLNSMRSSRWPLIGSSVKSLWQIAHREDLGANPRLVWFLRWLSEECRSLASNLLVVCKRVWNKRS